MSCYVLLCFGMFLICFAMFFCYVLLCFAMFCYILLYFCYILLCSAMFCNVLSCFLLRFATFGYVLQCFAMFCYVLLRFVMFRYDFAIGFLCFCMFCYVWLCLFSGLCTAWWVRGAQPISLLVHSISPSAFSLMLYAQTLNSTT